MCYLGYERRSLKAASARSVESGATLARWRSLVDRRSDSSVISSTVRCSHCCFSANSCSRELNLLHSVRESTGSSRDLRRHRDTLPCLSSVTNERSTPRDWDTPFALSPAFLAISWVVPDSPQFSSASRIILCRGVNTFTCAPCCFFLIALYTRK
jgi:hypothetical protein